MRISIKHDSRTVITGSPLLRNQVEHRVDISDPDSAAHLRAGLVTAHADGRNCFKGKVRTGISSSEWFTKVGIK